ncbi:MAG TPA: hypothetical protein VGM98_12765 [Schlesneria sp.]
MDETRNEKLRDEQAAITAAIYVICWPIGIVLLMIGLFNPRLMVAVLLVPTFATLCGIGMLVGLGVGVATHKFCYGTSIQSKWISVSVAAIIDFTVFGWIVVINYPPGR